MFMCQSNPKWIRSLNIITFHQHFSITEEREDCSRVVVYLKAIKQNDTKKNNHTYQNASIALVQPLPVNSVCFKQIV